MFEQIKIYANAILAVILLAGLSYSHWYSWSHGKAAGEAVVQAKFDSYKENINEQVQKAKDAAAKTKLEQDAKYDKAQRNYAADVRTLSERLLNYQGMPWGCSVPVANTGGTEQSMSSKTTSATGTINPTTFGAGTFATGRDFWEAAMKDTLQCRSLIQFVSDNKD